MKMDRNKMCFVKALNLRSTHFGHLWEVYDLNSLTCTLKVSWSTSSCYLYSVYVYCRFGKVRDRGNGSMDKMMDSSFNLNHLSCENCGLFPVPQRRGKYCAGLSLSLSCIQVQTLKPSLLVIRSLFYLYKLFKLVPKIRNSQLVLVRHAIFIGYTAFQIQ